SVPSKIHVTGGTRTRLRVDLSATFLPCVDLAAPPHGLAGRCAVSGDVVPVQALQPVLAPTHQASFRACHLATPGRINAPPAHPVREAAGRNRSARSSACHRRGRWRLTYSRQRAHPPSGDGLRKIGRLSGGIKALGRLAADEIDSREDRGDPRPLLPARTF